ncbi:hypothetical protein BESB_077750 [Besnoitia besnoiti]|uniref:Uncharacterized protein n=1 Tax=Besnoitia besnoiti TaxID=94643 RepID=A0A2A9M4Z3_BESBE|nr:hypothetical protein BESB_077750 [Besnoitia besnoiti]PFH33558.1 hypothetical protein BESB_077750 [Besnoitia besnoiti]
MKRRRPCVAGTAPPRQAQTERRVTSLLRRVKLRTKNQSFQRQTPLLCVWRKTQVKAEAVSRSVNSSAMPGVQTARELALHFRWSAPFEGEEELPDGGASTEITAQKSWRVMQKAFPHDSRSEKTESMQRAETCAPPFAPSPREQAPAAASFAGLACCGLRQLLADGGLDSGVPPERSFPCGFREQGAETPDSFAPLSVPSTRPSRRAAPGACLRYGWRSFAHFPASGSCLFSSSPAHAPCPRRFGCPSVSAVDGAARRASRESFCFPVSTRSLLSVVLPPLSSCPRCAPPASAPPPCGKASAGASVSSQAPSSASVSLTLPASPPLPGALLSPLVNASRGAVQSLRRRHSARSACRPASLLVAPLWLALSLFFLAGPSREAAPLFADAVICRVDASEGLVAAAAAGGGAAAPFDVFALPLCRLPYLVNSAIPPRDAPHVGLDAGGVIEIDLELLPANYVNNLPLPQPRFSGIESLSTVSYFLESPEPDSAEPARGESPSRGLAALPAALSSSSLAPPVAEGSSWLSGPRPLSSAWPWSLADAHAAYRRGVSAAEGLVGALASWLREVVAAVSPTLLYRLADEARSDPESGGLPRLGQKAPEASAGSLLGQVAPMSAAQAWSEHEARRLQSVPVADDPPVVTTVNNTYVLVMDHFQFLFFEQEKDWLPSFTASDGVVASSYVPAFKRLPFTSSRMHVRLRVPRRDRYAVVLLNADGLDLRFRGEVTFMNPGNQHLSVEQIALPATVFALMLLYVITSGGLALLMLVCRRRRWRAVHLLMLGNFLFSALSFALDWRQAVYVQEHGVRQPVLWLASRVLKKMQDIVALMTFILVALGWKTLRSHLSRIEVQFVAGLCVISLYLGLFEIILGGFQGTRYILHALGYICVLVAINANLALLYSHIADATLGPSIGELYHKYDGYKTYRWIFFLYLMKPVTLVFFKLTFLNLEYEQLLSWDEWIFVVVDNFIDYLIYLGLLYAFRPASSMRVLRDLTPDNGNAAVGARSTPPTSVWPA